MPNLPDHRGLIAKLFEVDFPTAQSAWVEEFLRLLVEPRATFGNDLDKVIILSLIGQQLMRDPAIPAISQADAQAAEFPDWARRNTNIDALARVSRIPRESVRRKVGELIADELVERDATGALVIRPGAAARLTPATQVSIDMLDVVVAKYLGRMVELGLLSVQRLPPSAGAA